MAVYKKTYRPYEGEMTPAWSRFLVIPRYAFAEMHGKRFLSIFFFASFIYPLICALIIYVQHNASALNLLGVQGAQGARGLISINVTFFMNLLGWQSILALFLASFIGPGQVSPDLANNALTLYLARPFSRVEYVLGKMSVLAILMSLMTWVPGLLCFGLEGYLEGWQWMRDNARLASGMFFGAWLWILLLALLALALSAWVKWKPAAGGLMFGVFFVAAAFGAVINGVQRTRWGNLFNISHLVGVIWVQLFEGSHNTTNGAAFFRVVQGEQLPLWTCWAALAALLLICLYMLARKIRGAEVVR
jgi:ABC-2 type transport system permease protein